MEKMIKVINDNLRTVINGIKTHKSDTESSLATIQSKMDDRVKLAGEYRANVEDARQIISTLENEISTLENDLNDLRQKFDSRDFKEILIVGSKEINNKIAEKKSLIAEQSQRIIALTDKAHKLKNELVSLKEKKIALEATLEKDNILEAYYENRIMEVIEFSEEHVADLSEYIEIEPQSTLMTSTNEVENIDITSVIDGSVFEEIDEISNSTDTDEFNEYINDVLDEGTIDLTDVDDTDEDDSEDNNELFMTQQIDDIISEANDLLEKSKNLEEQVINTDIVEESSIDSNSEEKEENEYSYGGTINLDEVEDISTPAPMYIEETDDDSDNSDDDKESTEEDDTTNDEGLTLSLNNDEEEIEIPEIEEEYVIEPYQPDDELENEEEIKTDEEYEESLLNSADTSNEFPLITDDVPEISLSGDVGNLGELNLTAPEDLVLDEDERTETDESDIVDEENMFSALAEFDSSDDGEEVQIENDPLEDVDLPSEDIEDDNTGEINEEDIPEVPALDTEAEEDVASQVKQEMEEANLDASKFSEEDLATIGEKYNKNNIINIVYIMRKHNIAISKIYECSNILANTASEELDYILTLLEKTNASSDSLSYVFGLLDKVDIYKLEEKLSAKTTYELSELLYDVIPYDGEVDLATILDLTPSEVNILRSIASTEEYEMFNQFSNIVEANYNELKKYNVNNLNECITKHPHRFLFNPDNFAAILDKYDAEDLTRCVNKNAAVIDKL